MANSIPREIIWQGTIEWTEKSEADSSKIVRYLPANILASSRDGEIEINADAWPSSLRMQFMPKQIIGLVGTEQFHNSKYIVINSNDMETLNDLTTVLNMGFAGIVQFAAVPNCDIRILILLYAPTKKVFLGLVPNDQLDYIRRLRETEMRLKEDYRRNCYEEEEPDR